MQAADWIELLKRIPVDDYDSLSIMTVGGVEVALQRIFRIDEKAILVRGRLGGTTELGRVFYIPYDRLLCLGFTKPVKEDWLTAVFGDLIKQIKHDPAREAALAAEEEAAAEAAAQIDKSTPTDKPTITTGALRERLKARLAAQGTDPRSKS